MKQKPQRNIILVVDDEEANVKLIVDYLQVYEFELIVARNGTTALQRAELAKPDLILLDVMLGDLDGFETCRQLKANPATQDIPVIFMTVMDNIESKLKGFQVGGVDYLTKPVQEAEMLARVRTHLTLRQLQYHLEEQVEFRTESLNEEITRRKSYQAEKEKLLEVIRYQSDQLSRLTQLLVAQQQRQREGMLQSLQEEIQERLTILNSHLELAQSLLTTSQPTDSPRVATHIDQALQISQFINDTLGQLMGNLKQVSVEEQTVMENPILQLTARELEVFRLLVDGKNVGQIALLLGLSDKTIYLHRDNLMQKLDLDNLADLVKLAIKHRLISIE